MRNGESTILTYHSLDGSASAISVTPELFRRHMHVLGEARVPVVPLSQVGSAPGSVALTFDDGYLNFFEHACPLLAEAGFPATVFIVSGYCGGKSAWSGRNGRAPVLPLMGWSELEGLAGLGIEVAAHSSNHVDLRTLTDSDLAEDLSVCRKQLEDRIGKRVTSLAYPYGASDARVRRVASERFTLACGTRLRRVSPNSDPFDLPRLDMHYFRRPERFRSVLEGRGGGYLSLRRVFREARLCLFR